MSKKIVSTGNNSNLKSLILCFFVSLSIFSCQTKNEKFDYDILAGHNQSEKQRGAHIFDHLDSTNMKSYVENNYEWITMVPWAGQLDYNDSSVGHSNGDTVEVRKTNEYYVSEITKAKENGFKIFIKPHVWIRRPTNGTWRSDVYPDNEEDWETWKNSYTGFILRYAAVAEEANADMFCVGTEFTRLTLEKPEYWIELIDEVRKVFSGKVTYAANWYEEFEKIEFWDKLDYVGIQAYFPLTKVKNPSVKLLEQGWEKHYPAMKEVSKKSKRKIIFTEVGYKSTSDAAITPWEWVDGLEEGVKVPSNETQANCYQAFFNTVWQEDWFAGAHIWQITRLEKLVRRNYYIDFTPQGKPAEKVIAKAFGGTP